MEKVEVSGRKSKNTLSVHCPLPPHCPMMPVSTHLSVNIQITLNSWENFRPKLSGLFKILTIWVLFRNTSFGYIPTGENIEISEIVGLCQVLLWPVAFSCTGGRGTINFLSPLTNYFRQWVFATLSPKLKKWTFKRWIICKSDNFVWFQKIMPAEVKKASALVHKFFWMWKLWCWPMCCPVSRLLIVWNKL